MLRIIKGPYLQWPTRNSITIMWETSCAARSRVTYYQTEKVHSGLNGKLRSIETSERIIENEDPCAIHTVTLTDLRPGTTYHYRVRATSNQGEQVNSEVYPLKTAVEAHMPFSFAVTSETGGYGDDEINRRIFDQMRRYRPDFLLMVGDAVKHGSRYEDWDKWFFAPAEVLLCNTPFYLCLGNHEEKSPWFYRFVSYPAPKNYYSFDYGNAHFTALDSTDLVDYTEGKPVATAALTPGSPQYEFLVDDLRSTRATWKIVFFHYPPYVSGDYQVEEMRTLCPILEAYDVDLVFNSHTIVYERSHPLRNNKLDTEAGVTYIVAGGAGAKPEWFHHKRAWHTAQALATPHFVQVVIAANTLELHAIDDAGHLFDTLKLTKPFSG